MLPRIASGATSKFASGGQSGTFNHNHASQMAHAAGLRMQAARALQGQPTARPPVTPGGPGGVPGGAPQQNYKAQLAGHMASRGMPVGVPQIHAAIDSLASKGKLTQFQAGALKMHNGPLHGQQGQNTMGMIAGELMAPKPVQPGVVPG